MNDNENCNNDNENDNSIGNEYETTRPPGLGDGHLTPGLKNYWKAVDMIEYKAKLGVYDYMAKLEKRKRELLKRAKLYREKAEATSDEEKKRMYTEKAESYKSRAEKVGCEKKKKDRDPQPFPAQT